MKKIYVYFYQEGERSPSGEVLEVGRCYGYSEQQYENSIEVDAPSKNMLDHIDEYKVIGGELVREALPPVQPSFEERQNDINIDNDFRISSLELGL